MRSIKTFLVAQLSKLIALFETHGGVYFRITTQEYLEFWEKQFNDHFRDPQGKYFLYQNNEKLQHKDEVLVYVEY